MAGPVEIPPWLNIDPTAPVGRLLEGYRSGLAAAEAQNQAAARAQQQELAAQQAAELNAYRQAQQAAEVKHWEDQLRFQQEKDQRAAAIAATQMEAQQGIQADLAAGMEWPQTLAKWAPKLFAGQPRGLAAAMEQVSGPRPPVYGQTPEGAPYAQDARTGAIHFVPASSLRGTFEPEIIDVGNGVKAVRLSPQHIQIIEKPKPEGSLSMLAKSRLSDIRAEEKALNAEMVSRQSARFQEKQDLLDGLKEERKAIYNGTWKPTPAAPAAATLPTVTTKEQFDSLNSGDVYIGKDGRQYRKP